MDNSEILSLFGTLPDVPLSTIFDYLNVPKLIMISLQFPEWKEFCYNRLQKINNENNQQFVLTFQNGVLSMLHEEQCNNYEVNILVNNLDAEFCFYRKKEDELFVECKNEKTMEKMCINVFKMINPPSIHSIDMNVDSNGKIEKVKLLRKILTGKTVGMLYMSGTEADIVDGNELNSIVEAVKNVNQMAMGLIPTVEFNYPESLRHAEVSSLVNRNEEEEILTIEHLKKVNCRSYKVDWYTSTALHVNAFLRSWKSGGNQNVRYMKLRLERCANVEAQVLKGLDAKEWDSKRREARFVMENRKIPYFMDFVDLSRSKDIIRSDGTVGTLLIQSGTIARFFVWTDRFPWRKHRESFEQRLVECEEFLAQYDKKLVEEIEEEMSKVDPMWKRYSFNFTLLDFYNEISGVKKKIIDELLIKERIQYGFEEYADYFSTFDN